MAFGATCLCLGFMPMGLPWPWQNGFLGNMPIGAALALTAYLGLGCLPMGCLGCVPHGAYVPSGATLALGACMPMALAACPLGLPWQHAHGGCLGTSCMLLPWLRAHEVALAMAAFPGLGCAPMATRLSLVCCMPWTWLHVDGATLAMAACMPQLRAHEDVPWPWHGCVRTRLPWPW